MINKLCVALFILSLHSLSFAQQRDKDDYVAIPTDIILLTVASPPGSPIQFENALLLKNVQQNSFAFSYDVRNVSSKPIAQWQPIFWTWMGTGSTLSSDTLALGESKALLPGEVFHESSSRLIPLTADLSKRLSLDQYRGGMVVLAVNTVTFSDGSRYDNSSFVSDLRSYFEQLATNLNKLENVSRDCHKRPR